MADSAEATSVSLSSSSTAAQPPAAAATTTTTTTENKRWADMADEDTSSTLENLAIDETKKVNNRFLDEPEDSNIKAVRDFEFLFFFSINVSILGFRVFSF